MSSPITIVNTNPISNIVKDDVSLSPPTDRKEGGGFLRRLLRFDLKKNSISESPPSTDPQVTFYGVYIPCEIKKGPDEEVIHVYENKSDALELVKKYKQARFKPFHSRQEAVAFALRGAEVPESDHADSPLMGERPYPFKAPSPQEMVALRRAIEGHQLEAVRERVWENPRYLVSSGNSPAILQEGSRYNALHVAAKAMDAEMCNLVLCTVGDPAFVERLYGQGTHPDLCKEFASFLVDRYLNTPDKGMNETALHFAAKFGSAACVDVLTAHPQCRRDLANKFGELPRDMICRRYAGEEDASETAARIGALLRERYYVPVLHCEDETAPPTVGAPFNPATPPELNRDPLSPRYEIRAFAGPMEAEAAARFRRTWKTPPRRLDAAGAGAGVGARAAFRLRDMTKGLETVGRQLAEELKVGWKEYWPFLDTFTDLRSGEGLALLERYLRARYEAVYARALHASCLQVQRDRTLPSLPSLPTLPHSSVSAQHSDRETSEMDDVLSPISGLCQAMQACNLSSARKSNARRIRIPTDPRQELGSPPKNGQSQLSQSFSQLLCIEGTCQVFAKRIADALLYSMPLAPETKYLFNTIHSYKDDARFQEIDFALIHSRLSRLVVHKLKLATSDNDDLKSVTEHLTGVVWAADDMFSSDDERKTSYRDVRLKKSNIIDSHVKCIAKFVLEELTEESEWGPFSTESECSQVWARGARCACEWRLEGCERRPAKGASFRRQRHVKNGLGADQFARRLDFEFGDGRCGEGRQRGCAPPPCVGDTAPAPPPAPVALQPPHEAGECPLLGENLISEDNSEATSGSDSDEYVTASESERDSTATPTANDSDDDDEMFDASDRAIVDAFICGEEPSKTDRLVYECVRDVEVSADLYPNVVRWRHTVALYPQHERDRWPAAPVSEEDSLEQFSYSLTLGAPRKTRDSMLDRCSTPKRGGSGAPSSSGPGASLQVSSWLRVTGPNSPHSPAAAKHSSSLGF